MKKILMLKGGSPAVHKLGDIGRKNDDLIRVHSETDAHYIGNFEEGFGFVDVKFKKEDCRLLTDEERGNLNGTWWGISGIPTYRIYVDEEGNVIKGEYKILKGVIKRITDLNGFDKYKDLHEREVSFQEDVQIGKSLPLFTSNLGVITTSRVNDVKILDSKYIIYTKNSVYYIDIV